MLGRASSNRQHDGRRDPQKVWQSDRWLTGLLVAACVLGAAVHLAPRLLVAHAPLRVEQPALTVSVQGEVAQPGSYTLPFGARVADAVAAAGGMTPRAAPAMVAAAAPLSDGQALVVPASMVRGTARQRLSLNAATASELETLPGIGPVIAARIIDNRPYAAVADLLRVPGIGTRTLARLDPLVSP